MTGAQIKEAAEQYIDEFIDDPEALAAINRGLGIIGDLALVYDDAQITVNPGQENTWIDLPADLTTIREVVTSSDLLTYTCWRQRDGLISFRDPGEYIVYYRRLPRAIKNITDTPEVHPAWHQVLVTFLIAYWKLKDDDENPDGLRHYELFREEVQRVFHTLSRNRGPGRVTVIRHA